MLLMREHRDIYTYSGPWHLESGIKFLYNHKQHFYVLQSALDIKDKVSVKKHS